MEHSVSTSVGHASDDGLEPHPNSALTVQAAQSRPHLLVRTGLAVIRRPEFGGFASTLIVFVIFAITAQNGFLTSVGIANWVTSSAEFGIIAIPIGLLMITGEFDLSVGATAGAGAIAVGVCSFEHLPALVGALVALALGGIIGLANGLVVTRTKLPSFIVTLSMMFVLSGGALGVALLASGSSSITVPQPGVSDPTLRVVYDLFSASYDNFQIVILWWVLLVVGASYLLFRTRFGNWIFATGGNEVAARGLGVPTNRVKILMFVFVGVCAAFVGSEQTFSYNTSSVDTGSGFIFIGIAACVIGGILLTGGHGSVLGTVFGSLTYGIIDAGVEYLGWNTSLAELFIGVFLLIAVLTNNYLRSMVAGVRSKE